jgi:cysteine-rich repeat protein
VYMKSTNYRKGMSPAYVLVAGSFVAIIAVAAVVFLRSQSLISDFLVPGLDSAGNLSASLTGGSSSAKYVTDAEGQADIEPDVHTVVKVPDSVGTIPIKALIHPGFKNVSFFIYVYDGQEQERSDKGKNVFKFTRFWYSDGYMSRNKDKNLKSAVIGVHGGDNLYVYVDGSTIPEQYDSLPLYFSAYRASGAQGGRRRNDETICGDGDLEGYEECDDGNNEDGDGCSMICKIEVEEEDE